MRIFVKVKTRAKEERVEKFDPPSPKGFERAGEPHFEVSITEPPVGGRANEAVLRALAEYFDVSKSQTKIVSGFTSRQKIVEISL